MKILKIFGIVAGIHLFALVVIFANPGCSSTTKRPPQPSDTAAPVMTAAPASAATAGASSSASSYYTSGGSESAPSAVSFNPEAPASATGALSPTPDVRFTPTRPGTPVAGALAPEGVSDVTPVTSTHVVQAGDNLSVIARKHGVTIAQLSAANNLTAKSTLKVGQKLMIPAKIAAPAPAPATAKGKATATDKSADAATAKAAANASMKHVVKAGESLGVIARNYGVKAGDIAVANNISDPAKIRAGMELVIPGWQATGEKKAVADKKASSDKKATTAKSSSAASTPAPRPTPSTSSAPITPAPAPVEAAPVERPAPPAVVPIIRIDEGQINPAPKSN